MDLSNDDILKILKIIEEAAYDEVRLEVGDFKLHVQKRGAQSPHRLRDRVETREPVRAPDADPREAAPARAPAAAAPR